MAARRTVVIIPCSKEKCWQTAPHLGAVRARDAYTSPLHKSAQRFAAANPGQWLILSALHGLLAPDDTIPGPYDVTFSRPDDPVISAVELAAQARRLRLAAADELILLCPDDYCDHLRAAIGPTSARVQLPLAGVALSDLARMQHRIDALPRPSERRRGDA